MNSDAIVIGAGFRFSVADLAVTSAALALLVVTTYFVTVGVIRLWWPR